MPTSKPIKGINDLATLYPDVAEEWHPNKNGDSLPSDFKPGSKHIAWWKGACGHEWEDPIYVRTSNGKSACPICTNRRVVAGINDLATTNPLLAKEWHPTKNGNLSASDVAAGSMKYAWWMCSQGHEWRALIRNRNLGYGCPICNAGTQTSFPEQSIYYYIKHFFPDAINRYSDMFDDLMEVDIYIPSKKIAVEYDGSKWHTGEKAETREQKKYEICKSKGVALFRVREKGLKKSDNCDFEICINERSTGETLDNAINQLLKKIGVNANCNTKQDSLIIQESYKQELLAHSLLSERPEIAEEWHPTKNGNLKPSMFSPYSGTKIWWRCSQGHVWEAQISQRSRGYGCPYCGGQKVIKGFNDLLTKYPQIAEEWHPTKNGTLTPTDISFGSAKKVWWICSKGHEYEADVQGRTEGRGCPYCASRILLVGFNDLATTNPKLAKEWHPTKNGSLKPTDVFEGGRQIVWWKCQNGHEWQAQISSRTKSGCPYCGNKKIDAGFNDLATTYPLIAKEWHLTKNGSLKPTDVTAGSRTKVWWTCPKGHEYQMGVSRRKLGCGCPYCSGSKVLSGYNDLATTNQKLAAEWDIESNGELTPQMVSAGSGKKAWWKCPQGHRYQMSISQRNLGSGCPFCSGHRLLVGFNDLAAVNPSLAAEWHPTKNGLLKPTDVMSCSTKVVWWKCPLGHEWEASVAHRKYSPTCPACRQMTIKDLTLRKGFE